MLKEIVETLAFLNKVETKGNESVKALAAAMVKLENAKRSIELGRKKEVTADEHSDGNEVHN